MWWKLRNQIAGFRELVYIYRRYFILLALVVISIILLQTNTNPQTTVIRRVFLFLTAGIGHYTAQLPVFISRSEYNRLMDQNIELAKRNMVLEDAYLENVKLRQIIRFRDRFPLTTLPAHIITKISDPKYNTLLLTAGYDKGVRKDMNVISARGLVGKISEVYDDHSVCEIILDERFRSAGKIQRTRLDGVLLWKSEMNEVGFYGVLKHFDVKIGDVILTSEYSDYYLPNVPVGVVYKINNEVPGLFKDIRVKTFTEFHRLEHVYILTDTTHSIAMKRGFEQSFLQTAQQ